jgi:hypothetical protein
MLTLKTLSYTANNYPQFKMASMQCPQSDADVLEDKILKSLQNK